MSKAKAEFTWDNLLKIVIDNGISRYKYGENKFQISLSGENFSGDYLEVHENGTISLYQKESIGLFKIDFDEVFTYEKIINIIDKILSDEYDYRVEYKLKVFKVNDEE